MLAIFIFGILIGSFLNVVIYRLPSNKSIATPPSSCGSCGHRLGALDLVPVLSYALLRGRCRHCGARISARYPLVEILTGGLFVLLFARYGFSALLLKYMVLSGILVAAAFIDMDHRIIPDKLNVFALACGMLFLLFFSDISIKSALLGLLAGGGFLLLIAIVSRGAMGGGDIKLFAVIGLFLGLPKTAMAMFLTFLIAGVVGLLLIATGLRSRKDYIPFGPFIATSAFIVLIWYNEIIIYYLKYLNYSN